MTGLRAYAATAALAILAGAGVAYCQHQGDDPAAPVDCAGVAYAVPAATKTKAPARRADTAPREVRKEPRAKASPSAAAVSPSPSSSPRRHNHIDLDLDLDGC